MCYWKIIQRRYTVKPQSFFLRFLNKRDCKWTRTTDCVNLETTKWLNDRPLCFDPQRSWGRTPPAEPWRLHTDNSSSVCRSGCTPQITPPPPILFSRRPAGWIINSPAAGLYVGRLTMITVTPLHKHWLTYWTQLRASSVQGCSTPPQHRLQTFQHYWSQKWQLNTSCWCRLALKGQKRDVSVINW